MHNTLSPSPAVIGVVFPQSASYVDMREDERGDRGAAVGLGRGALAVGVIERKQRRAVDAMLPVALDEGQLRHEGGRWHRRLVIKH